MGLLSRFCFRFKAPLQIHCGHPRGDPPGLPVPASVEASRGCRQIPVLCPGEWGVGGRPQPPRCLQLRPPEPPSFPAPCSPGLIQHQARFLPFRLSCLTPFSSTQPKVLGSEIQCRWVTERCFAGVKLKHTY